jgi:hypothetical protein
VDTASEYFARTCPRSRDTAAETRSYGCLYVDPGYRWISRTGASGPTSPFAISDKTIVAAVLTITTGDGTVVRRRLLSSSSESGAGMVDMGPAGSPAGSPPVRRLLSVDPAAKLRGGKGTSTLEIAKHDVNAEMNLAYLSGMEHDRWQTLEISTVRHPATPFVQFAGNVRALTLRLQGRMGALVKGVHVTGFEGAAAAGRGARAQPGSRSSSHRRLLAVPGVAALNYTSVDISAIVQMDKKFGNIYVNELGCALSALADQPQLLGGAAIDALVASCKRRSIPVAMRGFMSMRLATCAADMRALDQSECNRMRGVLAVIPGLAPPDTNQMAGETPALSFVLNLEMSLQDATGDTAVSDMLRQTVAETLGVGVSSVLVLFAAAEPAAQRRLLTVNTVATVFVYRDPRAQYSGSVVNTGSSGVGVTAWASARSALETIFDAMPALGVSGSITGANTNPQEGDRPNLPAPRLWVVRIDITVNVQHLTDEQGEALVEHLRMILVAQFPQLVAGRDVAMDSMGAMDDWSGVDTTVWVRFLTQADAAEAASVMKPMDEMLQDLLVQHLQSESDAPFSTIQASQVSLDLSASPFRVHVPKEKQAEQAQEEEEDESGSGTGVVVAVVCVSVALVVAAAA